jgi:hypothetical protein
MSEQELLKRIAELEARNLELLVENERFQEMLGLPQKESTVFSVRRRMQCPPSG